MKPWITPETVLDRPAFYYFKKALTCSARAEITLSLSADTRYLLTVNGRYVCEGPCIADTLTWKYETVTVPAGILREGENELSVRVMYMRPTDFGFFSGIRRQCPALWLQGTVRDGGTETEIAADESWTCLADYGCDLVPSQNTHPAMPPVQVVREENDLRPTGVKTYAHNHLETHSFGPFGLADSFELEPRSIPNLAPEAPKPFAEVRRGETFLELDAGVYTTAYPTFSFRGARGGSIRVTYAECYVTREGERLKKGLRDDTGGEIVGAYDTVFFSGEDQTFTPYWYKAFRFVRLDFPAGTEVSLAGQSYRPYFYPLSDEAEFACDDEARNRMWEVSKNTLLCSSHETFVDCPYYEQCQYDMDSAVEAAVMMRLTRDTRLVRKAIVDLSRSQRPDGMLAAHYPSMAPQVIPGFSIFWVLMLEDYIFYTGDTGLGLELLPVADKIFTFFRTHMTAEGLCATTHFWHFVDWVPGWANGVPLGETEKPFTVGSMMFAAGLKSAANVAQWCGRTALAEEYRALAGTVIQAVNARCYDPEAGMYVDVPGREPAYSEHTAVWAILSGCAEGEVARALAERTFAGDAPVSHASFSFNYYTFRALEAAGLYKEYAGKLFGGWRWMLDMHCTTWCENPDDPRSECHGWSSAPLHESSRMVLGVKPAALGCRELVIEPDVEGYQWARGTVPTPLGYVSVEWKRGEGLKITGPEGQLKRIRLPGRAEMATGAAEIVLPL